MTTHDFEIIDISQPVTTRTACFPGDVPFSQAMTCTFEDSKVVNLTSVTLSPHVGTHTDAPAHVKGSMADTNQLIGGLPLEPFVGRCAVLDLSPMGIGSITAAQVSAGLDALDDAWKAAGSLAWPTRFLIKTQAQSQPEKFLREYPYLGIDAIDHLYERGATLIGVDTPSVDHIRAKELIAHKQLILRSIYWLENLDLSAAEPGFYFLSAAPIKLVDTEAAPVRALLLKGLI